MTMDCQETQALLSEYLDGALDAARAEDLRRHLKSCEACRKEQRALEQVVTELRSLEPVPAPAGFLKAFQERREARFAWRKWLSGFLAPRRLAPLAGALVSAVLVVSLLTQERQEIERPSSLKEQVSEKTGTLAERDMDLPAVAPPMAAPAPEKPEAALKGRPGRAEHKAFRSLAARAVEETPAAGVGEGGLVLHLRAGAERGKIEAWVVQVQGRILASGQKEGEFLQIEIPRHAFSELGRLVAPWIQESLPETLPKGAKTLRIEIHFTSPAR